MIYLKLNKKLKTLYVEKLNTQSICSSIKSIFQKFLT